MNQEQHKEQWIKEIMASTEGIQPPAANPFLYEKIKYRMEGGRSGTYSFGRARVVGWATAILLLLAVNGVSIVTIITWEKHTLHAAVYDAMANEMQTQVIYNY